MNAKLPNNYNRISRQVDSVRRIYSKIGQPLPVDIIIDLHHCLAKAMELAGEQRMMVKKKHKTQ